MNSSPGKKGMVLPFVPLSTTFEDIRYSVDMPQVSALRKLLEIQIFLISYMCKLTMQILLYVYHLRVKNSIYNGFIQQNLQEIKAQGVTESRLELLKGISGSFRPGVLTALMGVSGAGKTTLMDVLAGRKTSGYIEGNITISGYPKKQETFARVSGYCEQNDIHSPNVTVYESLAFSAWLRLPADVDSSTRKVC